MDPKYEQYILDSLKILLPEFKREENCHGKIGDFVHYGND